jgi:hypothetical protein
MHSDAAALFSLLWIHQAELGGESQFSSGPAAHNTILATRPDILPILYRGFPHHRRSEQPDDQPDVTPYDVPIFSNVDGRICINFTYSSILPRCTSWADDAEERKRSTSCAPGWSATGRAAHAAGRRGDGEQLRPSTHFRTSSTVPTPSAGWLRGRRCRSRTAGPDRRVLPHGERGGHLGYDPVPGREGRIAINDYATSTGTSPTCSEARKEAKLD